MRRSRCSQGWRGLSLPRVSVNRSIPAVSARPRLAHGSERQWPVCSQRGYTNWWWNWISGHRFWSCNILAFLSNEGTSGRNVEWFDCNNSQRKYVHASPIPVCRSWTAQQHRPAAAEDPVVWLSVFHTEGLARFLEDREVVWTGEPGYFLCHQMTVMCAFCRQNRPREQPGSASPRSAAQEALPNTAFPQFCCFTTESFGSGSLALGAPALRHGPHERCRTRGGAAARRAAGTAGRGSPRPPGRGLRAAPRGLFQDPSQAAPSASGAVRPPLSFQPGLLQPIPGPEPPPLGAAHKAPLSPPRPRDHEAGAALGSPPRPAPARGGAGCAERRRERGRPGGAVAPPRPRAPPRARGRPGLRGASPVTSAPRRRPPRPRRPGPAAPLRRLPWRPGLRPRRRPGLASPSRAHLQRGPPPDAPPCRGGRTRECGKAGGAPAERREERVKRAKSRMDRGKGAGAARPPARLPCGAGLPRPGREGAGRASQAPMWGSESPQPSPRVTESPPGQAPPVCVRGEGSGQNLRRCAATPLGDRRVPPRPCPLPLMKSI
ncbi:translation initiation factor IF-2-like [Motacilla alba alba]|uniref:translation initiation factor IF-2-like n=1 Tax=Motacilla alba alba TaxID=1094192 RepID=UPI0018D5184B|nr:translation initiation factor IF-2-like [Motacilla alba alba]